MKAGMKLTLASVFVGALLFVSAACGGVALASKEVGSAGDNCLSGSVSYCKISMLTLFGNPEAWIGRKVSFKGYVTSGGEVMSIWPSRQFSEAYILENSIEIVSSSDEDRRGIRLVDGQYAQISGVLFESSDKRRLLTLKADRLPELVPWIEEQTEKPPVH